MFAKLMHRVMAAVVVLLAAAAGARLAAELMEPLVPLLIVAVTLGVIYALLFNRFR
ncbi:hypothetical protein ACQPXM_33780 [Kribbella sp. CA-253562]|uniref:hypothetical protein n=1 Tax=Kribbella sp. CA-253562 TaxID=3239942 RepID=UPI003D8F8D18